MTACETVERWGIFELDPERAGRRESVPGRRVRPPSSGRHRMVSVDGFYDGDGVTRSGSAGPGGPRGRIAPLSSAGELDGIRVGSPAEPPAEGNHGPVRVVGGWRFEYADGTRYVPYGTTCYHWTHTRRRSSRRADAAHPGRLPVQQDQDVPAADRGDDPTSARVRRRHPGAAGPGHLDRTRFDPEFFAHFEARIADLLRLGIEADVDHLPPVRQGALGRGQPDAGPGSVPASATWSPALGAFRNVWWSMSNEFDFNKAKTVRTGTGSGSICSGRSVPAAGVDPQRHRDVRVRADLRLRQALDDPPVHPALGRPVRPGMAGEGTQAGGDRRDRLRGDIDRRWGNLSGDEHCCGGSGTG